MMFGVGWIDTSATSAIGTCPPSGVSIGRFRMAVRLSRLVGMLHTLTSYVLPPR